MHRCSLSVCMHVLCECSACMCEYECECVYACVCVCLCVHNILCCITILFSLWLSFPFLLQYAVIVFLVAMLELVIGIYFKTHLAEIVSALSG